MLSCIFFDLDGTLVDSEKLCNIALAQNFKPYGLTLDPDELVIKYKGWELSKILANITTEFNLELSDNFVEQYRKAVAALFETELKPIPNIEYALKHQPNPKAVVSSAPSAKIHQALKVCHLSQYFGANIYSAYDIKIWKPDPKIYLHAAQDMGFPPANCAVVEDSETGVEAGYKAGMRTFYYSPTNEPSQYKSVTIFSEMKNLPALINASSP